MTDTKILPIGVPADDVTVVMRRFTVTGMEGETPDPSSHRAQSDYVEDSWMAYLGPIAIAFVRRVDKILATDHKYAVDTHKWAEQMGITAEELIAACHRLCRFGLATWGDRDPMLLVQRWYPPVPPAIRTPAHRQVLINLPDVQP